MSSASSNNSESASERSSEQNSSAQDGSNSEQSESGSRSNATSRSSIPSQILKGLEFDTQSIKLSQIGRDVESIARDNNQFCNQLNRQVYFQNGYNYGINSNLDRFGVKSLYQNKSTIGEYKSNFNSYGRYRFEEVNKMQQSPNKSIIKQNTSNLDHIDLQSDEKKCAQCLDRSIQANLSRAPTTRSIQESTQKKPSLDIGSIPIRVEDNLSVNRNTLNNKSQKANELNQTENRFQIGKESQQIINNYYKQVQDKRRIMNTSKQQISSLYKNQVERNVYDEYELKKSRAISAYQEDNDKFSRNRNSSIYQSSQNRSRIDSRSIDIAIKTLLNK